MPTMAYASWMLARLKRETAVHHAAADGDRLRLLSANSTSETYRESLVRIYGFEAPVEAAAALTRGLDDVIDFAARQKMRLLRADLIGLGVPDPVGVPRYRMLPFRESAEALGWMYVSERNTLLHTVIHRFLSVKLPEVVGAGGGYLGSHERASQSRWTELGMALDHVGRDREAGNRIVAAAHVAFRAQRQWYDTPHALAS